MWYCLINGQHLGPFSEEQFDQMIATGRVTPDTRVRRKGQAGWQPLSEVSREFTGIEICQICHRQVDADQMIDLSGTRVCAACKTATLQKMREGVPLQPVYRPRRQRPVMVWIISLLYFVTAPLGALALLFISTLVFRGIHMSEAMRHYVQSLTATDYYLEAVRLTLELTGAILLFQLRRGAFLCFAGLLVFIVINFAYQFAFRNWLDIASHHSGGLPTAITIMIISLGLHIAIVWYVWHLKNTNVLR